MRKFAIAWGIGLALAWPAQAQPVLGGPPRADMPRSAAPPSRQESRPELPRGMNGSMALPQPNHGGTRLNERNWRAGRWYHGSHDGRFGWWWTVGPQWFFYDRPAYPFPDIYGPAGAASGWWYWCDAYQDYYPFVTRCPSGWRTVPPR